MNHAILAVIALFTIAFAAVSGRIGRTYITPPMAFVFFGALVGGLGFDLIPLDAEHPAIHLIAEITLIVVLFTDAAGINLARLRLDHKIPVRLLALGMPLTMIAGAGAAYALFPNLGFGGAMLLAIILAPTDAALGQAVISSPRAPRRIRQALNVESGLNDGIALPILLFFICFAGQSTDVGAENWLLLAGKQLILGPLMGAAVGYFGGKLLLWGQRTRAITESFEALSSLALAILSFAAAEVIGGNGFLAAFTAGLILGNTAKGICHNIYEFAETEGQLLALLTFLFFAAVMLPPAIEHFEPAMLVYAVLSLTVIRMIPVALALLGSRLKPATNLFLGWFGPRGVASIIYALLVLEESLPFREELFHIAMITVLLSVFTHGLTAWPAVNAYGRTMRPHEKPGPDGVLAPEMRAEPPAEAGRTS